MKWKKHKITPSHAQRQLQGATSLGPGIWLDREGNPHVSIPDLMAYLGLEDTPAERQQVTRFVADYLANTLGINVIQQDLKTDG